MIGQSAKCGISASTLKIIAIIGMTLDHIGSMYRSQLPFPAVCALYALGGLTFPIMAYLLGEGYRHTSNFKKYATRLLIFACLAELPFRLFLNSNRGNVLFTLFLGLLVLYVYEHKSQELFIVAFIGGTIVSTFFDWGGMGVPMIVIYYVVKNRLSRVVLPYLLPAFTILAEAVVHTIQNHNLAALPGILYVGVGCTLTIPLLLNYNGKKGKSMKYFFYIYYPLHILVLGIVGKIVF